MLQVVECLRTPEESSPGLPPRPKFSGLGCPLPLDHVFFLPLNGRGLDILPISWHPAPEHSGAVDFTSDISAIRAQFGHSLSC